MDGATVTIIGLMVSPIYVFILYQLKKLSQMDNKLTKVCTFIKTKYTDARDILG